MKTSKPARTPHCCGSTSRCCPQYLSDDGLCDRAYYAKDAYSKVLAAAQQINIPVEQEASPADYKAHGSNYMFTDDFTPGRKK
jgi:hypothetical protein